MIVCVWLPHFALRVVAHRSHALSEPLALSSVVATHPVVIDCTLSARAEGVAPGMLISRAMGCCAELQVLDYEDEVVESAAERFVARLEAIGAAVQPLEHGRIYFDGQPLERLYGGRAGVVARVQECFASPDVRLGLGPNPFVAWVAARHAQPGGYLAIEQGEAQRVLAEMSLRLLPADERFFELLQALGMTTLGEFASIGRDQVSDRFGEPGLLLWQYARGVDERVLQPRQPSDPVETELQFPEPVANVQTLQRAVRMLVERAVAKPQCVLHAPRSVVVVAWLSTGGSWRSRRVLRTAMVDAGKITLTAEVGLEDVPAPVERLCVRLEDFELRAATQQSLLGRRAISGSAEGMNADDQAMHDQLVQKSVRHVQAALGDEALLQVLEVEPDSRVPERHAVLVPRHQAGEGDGGSGSVGRGVWE